MKHPFKNDPHKKTYEKLCKRIESFYGVDDAEIFYKSQRQMILDKCIQDQFRIAEFCSLKDWHENISIERGYGS
ncbi:MAG: hypothetical protein WC236_13725 [Gallionellaceae bacterium]|jgi:hypothetical protein